MLWRQLNRYPYYNEPGYENQQGTAEGERQRRVSENGGYERLRVGTVQWAMVDQLQNPPPGFEVRARVLMWCGGVFGRASPCMLIT